MQDFLSTHEQRCDWISTRNLWDEFHKWVKGGASLTCEDAVSIFVNNKLQQQDSADIMRRVKHDFEYIQSLGYTPLAITLTGSQNYGLDYEKSDVDTKAIVIPSLSDMLQEKPASKTVVLDTNEHIDVKDVRLYVDLLKRCSPQWLESISTRYKYINPDYVFLFSQIVDISNNLLRCDEKKFYNVCKGQIMGKLKDMTHERPGNEYDLKHFGYDTKCCYHIHRFAELAQRYHDFPQMPYSQMLWCSQRDYILKIKRGQVPKETAVMEATQKAKEYIPIIEKWAEEAKTPNVDWCYKHLDSVLYKTVAFNIAKEVKAYVRQ